MFLLPTEQRKEDLTLMNSEKFMMGAWVYNDVGELSSEKYVSDLLEAGMNVGFSSRYNGEKEKRDEYIREFDEAERRGIQLIAYDFRTHWRTLAARGESAFIEGVKEIRKEYGLHDGVCAFHIGDEPGKSDFDNVIKAARIVKEIIPEKQVFVNFFPYFDGEWFRTGVGANIRADYGESVKNIVKSAALPVISYDCYSQCREDRDINGVRAYFENLEFFRALSLETKTPLWTSLLCVGHWDYRVPDENDIRWQISTAAAFGCKGILWFSFYSSQKDSYREAPIYGLNKTDRCETFYRLKRQIGFFMQRYGDKFARAEVYKIMQLGEVCGSTMPFSSDELIHSVAAYSFDAPLLISELIQSDGNKAVVVVNKSQTRSTRVRIMPGEGYEILSACETHLAPGDLWWIDIKKKTEEER